MTVETQNKAEADKSSNDQQDLKDRAISTWRLTTVIGALFLGTFLFGLDVNIIGVAIPYITTQFKSLPDVSWYGAAYLLTVTAFQPLFGNLYKFFDAKGVYLASLATFEVGSIVCATANISAALIIGRAVLGLGAAGLLQGALALIGQSVSIEEVPMYLGIVVSSMVVSTCCGPVIGGVLTQHVNWRWCFWINVPAGAFVMAIIIFFTKTDKTKDANRKLALAEKIRRMDLPGLVIFLSAVTCLLLALTWGGQRYAWKSRQTIGLFVGSGLLIVIFCVWVVIKGEYALIPLRVLRKRSIYVGAIVSGCFGLLSVVYGYYLPLFFQTVQGASIVGSGVRFIAFVGTNLFGLIVTGALVTQFGYYVPYQILGGVIGSVGCGLLTRLDPNTSTAQWAIFLIIAGLGLGIGGQLSFTALQVVLEPADVQTGNAINVFTIHLAGAIGLAIGQQLLISGLRTSVPHHTHAITAQQVISYGPQGLSYSGKTPELLEALRWAYSDALRGTFIIGLVGVAAAAPVACFMEWLNVKNVAAQRKADKEAKTDGSSLMEQGEDKDEKETQVAVNVVDKAV